MKNQPQELKWYAYQNIQQLCTVCMSREDMDRVQSGAARVMLVPVPLRDRQVAAAAAAIRRMGVGEADSVAEIAVAAALAVRE